MAFGFKEGFAMGSSIVDTYVDVKKNREKLEAEENIRLRESKAKAEKEALDFKYKIEQDMAKYSKDAGEAQTKGDIASYNSAVTNIRKAGAYIGVEAGEPTVFKTSLPDTKGAMKEVVLDTAITSIENWENQFIVGEDGNLVQKPVIAGKISNNPSDYITTNMSDLSSRFIPSGSDSDLTKSKMIVVKDLRKDSPTFNKTIEITRNDYIGNQASFERKDDSSGASSRVVQVKGYDGKPRWVSATDAAQGNMEVWENPTGKEKEAEALIATDSFQKKYGHMSIAEQVNQAMQEVSTRPTSFDSKVKEVGSTFSIENKDLDVSNIDTNYSNMDNNQKGKLNIYQQNSLDGKEYKANHHQKAIGVDEIAKQINTFSKLEKSWDKGIVKNQLGTLASMIPDSWNGLDADTKASTLAQIKGQGLLGNIFFTYLNKVNKGAPSDADMRVMKEIVTAGENASFSATKEALSTWFTSVKSDSNSYYKGAYSEINTLISKEEKKALKNNGFYNKESNAVDSKGIPSMKVDAMEHKSGIDAIINRMKEDKKRNQ